MFETTPEGRRIERRVNDVPREGAGGLFSATWYPVASSEDVPDGRVLGVDFLDGRAIVVRDQSGAAQVMSAYCPHVGADLSAGTVEAGRIRCPFHSWEFDGSGRCVATGCGDPAPPRAGLFRFPTVEKHGLVWAFNGEAPGFELPWFDRAPRRFVSRVADTIEYRNDPWTLCSNSPDYVHFRSVHRLELDVDLAVQASGTEWLPHGLRKRWTARLDQGRGDRYEFTSSVFATNLVLVDAVHVDSGTWTGVLAAQSIPAPGRSRVFPVAFTQSAGDSPDARARNDATLDLVASFVTAMGHEDIPLLEAMRYSPAHLTRQDGLLARYLDLVRKFPRAHPSRDFIRP
jgi:nitrite reductase/ring-hydroxylating ferredoxin subunit